MRRLLPIAILLAGCGDDPVRILDGACAFGEEHRLGVPDGPVVHDLALAAEGERAWAAWSDRSGAYVRELDAEGAPRGESVRLGAPCDAGLAIAVREGTPWVACGRRGDADRGDEGGVQLVAIREGRVEGHGAFGPVGPDGDGVALDLGGAAPRVGWRDASGAVSSAWIAEAREGVAPERLSTPPFRASAPALATRADGTPVSAWGETWLDASGDPEGRVELRIGQRAARAVADLAFDQPAPVLRASGDDVVIAFRDRRPAGSRPRVQIARVPPGEVALGRVEASSHANTVGEALAIGCGDHVFVVAPRTHSRTERLVSVRRYSRELAPLGPEQQIYEHGAAFEHADAQCVGGHLLVAFAGRPSRIQREGTVRAVRVTCAEPEE